MQKTPYKVPRIHLQVVREKVKNEYCKPFHNAEDVYQLLKAITRYEREHLLIVHLDTANVPVGIETAAIGGLNVAHISAREIFKAAIVSNSNSIIVVHNHPAGTFEPSDADNTITKKLTAAGDLLGIPVLDHIIMSTEGLYSYRDAGKL